MADAKKTTKTTVKKTAKNVKDAAVKTLEELQTELTTAVNDLADSRRSHAQGELVNPHILTTQRKAIARLKTAIAAAEKQGKESK